jgi:hypothetical protein
MSDYNNRSSVASTSIQSILCFACLLFFSIPAKSEVLCNVADPQDPTLNVRDSPAGSVINQLRNGRVVRIGQTKADSSGKSWVEVSGIYNGEWRNWGWVFASRLQCVDAGKFSKESLSIEVLRAAGIVPQNVWDAKNNRSGNLLPVSCDEVPNGWGVTLSNELYEAYRQRGFSRTAVCLALGGNRVYFDPATGQQLRLYRVGDDTLSVRPIWLPDCYRSVQVIREGGYLIGWRPTGCSMRYHPSTGLPIVSQDVVELSAGGEAGGGVDEDNRSSTVSEARARELTHGK